MTRDMENVILDAALYVIAERTLYNSSMSSIASKANVVQSNIHYYFKTKQNLILALQEKILTDFINERKDMQSKITDSNTELQLDVLIDQKRKNIQQRPEYEQVQIDFWVHSNVNEEIRQRVVASYSCWREELRNAFLQIKNIDEVKSKMLAFTAASMMEGAVMQYLADSESIDLNAYFDYCKSIILNEINSA